jgi:hypothetical protein
MSIEMAVQDALQQQLQDEATYPYSSALKCSILTSLFGWKQSADDVENDFDLWRGYFEYYHTECDMAIRADSVHWVLETHQDIIRVAQLLQNTENTRESIKSKERDRLIKTQPEINDTMLCSAIDLVARLKYMTLIEGSSEQQQQQLVHGGERSAQVIRVAERRVTWQDGRLDLLLGTEFGKAGVLEKEHVKLGKMFNACNLDRIAGFKIIWTRNLANHLRVHEDADTEVSIFHYASFLNLQKGR